MVVSTATLAHSKSFSLPPRRFVQWLASERSQEQLGLFCTSRSCQIWVRFAFRLHRTALPQKKAPPLGGLPQDCTTSSCDPVFSILRSAESQLFAHANPLNDTMLSSSTSALVAMHFL
jgi:hypothetical protein